MNNTAKIIEIGTVSSRGQIAIPAEIRRKLVLDEGERIVFAVEGNTLLIKKFDEEKTWKEITAPLREAVKKSRLNESEAVDFVSKFRKSKTR